MAAAPIAAISTPPAATSLVFFARIWYSGDTKSVIYSNPVLNASALNTKTMANIVKHHSVFSMEKNQPIKITTVVANRWILKFGCDFINSSTPSSAYLKLLELRLNIRNIGVKLISSFNTDMVGTRCI